MVILNPPPPPPPHPRYISSNISRTRWATNLKLSDNLKTQCRSPPSEIVLDPIGELSTRFHGHFICLKIGLGRETFSSKITKVSVKSCGQFKETNFQNKKISPPLVTIATSKVDPCFWKHTFRQFSYKSSPELDVLFFFFAISMKSVPNVVLCGNLGLRSRFMASWWQFSFPTLFMLQRPYHHGIKNGVIRFGFLNALRKVTFVDFQQRKQGFRSLNRDSQSKIWNYESPQNANHGFHGNQFVSRDSFLDKLAEKLYLNGFWEE